jgi:hypothetical protein
VFAVLDEEGAGTEEKLLLRMSSVCVTKREIIEHQSADGHTRTLEIREVEDENLTGKERRQMTDAEVMKQKIEEKKRQIESFMAPRLYRPRAFE